MAGRFLCFVAPPFAGHLYPMLPLAAAAQAAGYRVEIVTGAAKRAAVAAAGLPARSLPCLAGSAMERIADTDQRVGSHPLRLLRQLRASLALSAQARDELAALWRQDRPDLVIADSVAIAAGLAADAAGITWINTIATPFALENRQGVPAYLGGWRPGDGVACRLRDAAGRAAIRSAKQGLAFLVRRELGALGARLYRADGAEAAYSPRAILGFGLTELEFDRDWPSAFTMIGPVFANPEPVPVPDLPAGRPRVLVTLGTHLPWAKAHLAEDIVWLAQHRPGFCFIGSAGAPERSGEPLRQLAPNGWLLPFLPYAAGLGQFDAIIHHGGAGITYAALAHGLPSIVVPHDYDQFDYAARLSAKGAGLRVRRLRSRALLAALDRIGRPETCPGLPGLKAAAAAYRPAERFLSIVDSIIGG